MIAKKINIFVFFSLLVIFPVLTIFSTKETFSENENKVLSKFPSFSFDSFINREYTQKFDKYFSDHFILRDKWISVNSYIEYLLGKREISGVYILKNRLLEKVSHIKSENKMYIKSSLDAINKFSDKYNMPVLFMLIPTAQEIYKDQILLNPTIINQKYLIDRMYGYIESNVTTLDAYTPISLNKDKYIYYNTDHHWTSLGAYYTYSYIGKNLGFNPISYDSFNIEHSTYNFIGTLYSKVLYNFVDADNIDIYFNTQTKVESYIIDDGIESKTYDSIIFRENLNKKDKYNVFLGGNYPYANIKTSNKNGKKLLLFKDSYSNTLIQFLYNHYEEISIIDLRFLNISFEKYVDMSDISQVLFSYNFSNFIEENNIKKVLLTN